MNFIDLLYWVFVFLFVSLTKLCTGIDNKYIIIAALVLPALLIRFLKTMSENFTPELRTLS
jgi:hypothetical protein